MAKYDFSNSRYPMLWDPNDGPVALQELVSPELIRANHTFYREQFSIDPYTTPRGADGTANFTSKMRELKPSHMADMRAPLGDTKPEEKHGEAAYQGSIPAFSAPGFVETALEREYKEKMFQEYFGNDAEIIRGYLDTVQGKVDSLDQTLSHMAAQLISTGEIIYNQGRGIKGAVLKADIPSANFVKAGESVWSDTTAKILTQMVTIQNTFEDKWGDMVPMMWQIPYDMFVNVFLPNEQVIEWVRYMRTINNTPLPESLVLTQELVNQYLPSYPGLYPIEVVTEKQHGWDGTVSGWKANTAVLRPQGFAGQIKHAEFAEQTLHEKYGSSVVSKVFAKTNSGVYTIVNTTLNNGNFKEWHTDAFMDAVPALDEFLRHVIVDTATADE